jgi:hypothetical protein
MDSGNPKIEYSEKRVRYLAGRVKFYDQELQGIRYYTYFIERHRERLDNANEEGLDEEDLEQLRHLKVAYSTLDEVQYGVAADLDVKPGWLSNYTYGADPVYDRYIAGTMEQSDMPLWVVIRGTYIQLLERETLTDCWRYKNSEHINQWREARCYMEFLDPEKKKQWKQIDWVYKQFEQLERRHEGQATLTTTGSAPENDFYTTLSDTGEFVSIELSTSSGDVTNRTADSLSLQ